MRGFASFLVVFLVGYALAFTGTALDDYVNAPDDVYNYHINNITRGYSYTLYRLTMTSQRWQTPSFSDHHIWNHTMIICVPDVVVYTSHAFMIIVSGDDLIDADLSSENFESFSVAVCKTGAISASIHQIPNQPITFADSGPLVEDQIIAHTFRTFLNTSGANPSQLLQFPMAKAAKRGMDTVQNFAATKIPGKAFNIANFTVSGGSKRGWATWLVSAVDPRVVATIPIVIPLLSLERNILDEWRSLGEWGWALDDYTAQKIFDYAGLPEFDLLMSHVDPLSYNDRYERFPKFVVDSTLDQFFLLDGPKYFWDKLKGPKYLTLMPNADHSFGTPGTHDQLSTLITSIFQIVATGAKVPQQSWKLKLSNDTQTVPYVEVTTKDNDKVQQVNMWSVTNTRPGKRDFRLNPCNDFENPECFAFLYNGVAYQPTPLAPIRVQGNTALYEGNFTDLVIASDITKQRWTGFFVQVTYAIPLPGTNKAVPLWFTSEANIFPDFYPFPAHVPDYGAIGQCDKSVTFEQVLANSWSNGVKQFSQWTVTIKTTLDLYAAQIAISAPARITDIWGLTKRGDLHEIPSYHYKNGKIPAAGNYVQFGYITESSAAASVTLSNNACFPKTSGCSVSVNPTVASQYKSNDQVYQRVTLDITNTGASPVANTQIQIEFIDGSYISQSWNLRPISTSGNFSLFECVPGSPVSSSQTYSPCGYIATSTSHRSPIALVSSPLAICL